MTKGLFISVEGTDGSGKSTQIELLKEYLNQKGYEFLYIREPGGTSIGEKIRDIVLDVSNSEMCAKTEMLLYAASRAQLVDQVIRPSIQDGKIVICDRFVDSSYAYQSFGRGLKLEDVRFVNNLAIDSKLPDLTILFDISPKDAMARRLNASVADRLESEPDAFYSKVYDGYKYMAKEAPERIKVIDARKSIEAISLEVRQIIDELFKS